MRSDEKAGGGRDVMGDEDGAVLLQRVADTLRGMRLDQRIPADARKVLSDLSDDLQALLDSAPDAER